jgi:hypothetical protein
MRINKYPRFMDIYIIGFLHKYKKHATHRRQLFILENNV